MAFGITNQHSFLLVEQDAIDGAVVVIEIADVEGCQEITVVESVNVNRRDASWNCYGCCVVSFFESLTVNGGCANRDVDGYWRVVGLCVMLADAQRRIRVTKRIPPTKPPIQEDQTSEDAKAYAQKTCAARSAVLK